MNNRNNKVKVISNALNRGANAMFSWHASAESKIEILKFLKNRFFVFFSKIKGGRA